MTILERIFQQKREELPDLERATPVADLRARVRDMPPTRGFRSALLDSPHRPSLIAEVKSASPTMGVIREDFDPVAIAIAYESAGVDAISVLTDRPHFRGATEHLVACRAAVSVPIIRKDFTAAEYHVYEARAMGADAILLIVNGLSDAELRDYRELAESLGMDVLVEAHSFEEAELALATGANLVGINNRDLATFETRLETSEEVIPQFRDRVPMVSESALATHADVERVAKAGARAVLIGTAFCSQPDVAQAVREVMGWSA